ncbi:MAG: ligase-associated DNA damage response endonuclease PdeM [Phycisphaerales bacterium]|nr:ligase-associated DNA damage response endonuclease PdeM [Phycisphaerales bacterium]
MPQASPSLHGAIDLTWAGEPWALLPGRAMLRRRTGSLLVTDMHLGKAAAFRNAGVPVPEATTSADLRRLTALIESTRPRDLIILGDLIHARSGRADETISVVAAWRATVASLPITLIRGNHDARAGDPPCDWDIRCVDDPFIIDGIAYCHAPCAAPIGAAAVLCGHIHPKVVLAPRRGSGGGGGSVTLRCFHLAPRCGILPAFGSFTGGARVHPVEGDRVFVIADDHVIEAPMAAPPRSSPRRPVRSS